MAADKQAFDAWLRTQEYPGREWFVFKAGWDAATELAVAHSAAPNTRSPKLLAQIEGARDLIHDGCSADAYQILCELSKQLRAGA